MSLGTLGNTRSIFAHTNITAVVGAIFDTVPVSSYDLDQCAAVIGFGLCTGNIISVFVLALVNFPGPQILSLAPNGDELPTSGQAGFFGAYTLALDAPALQTSILLIPATVILTGKKTPAGVLVRLAQGCHFDCPSG